MAKTSRSAAARRAPKGSGASAGPSRPAARSPAKAAKASPKRGAAQAAGASRWSRGKPVAARKVAAVRPTRVAPAPLAIRDPSHEEIAHHAYLRWLRHGGSEHENWFAAEIDLRTRRNALRATRTPKGSA